MPGDRGGQLVEVTTVPAPAWAASSSTVAREVGDPGQFGFGTERMRARARRPG